jgi:hypothetical protein
VSSKFQFVADQSVRLNLLPRAMAYPVPNSDDPSLVEKEPKTLRGWDLLVYRCKQQPLVPLGIAFFP